MAKKPWYLSSELSQGANLVNKLNIKTRVVMTRPTHANTNVGVLRLCFLLDNKFVSIIIVPVGKF
jgi:hypothetical protein